MTPRSATTLVVIDDDPDVLRATARVLTQAGYDVITGVNAAQALELTRRHLPAILLLDVMLPDGNGVDIARQLKSEPALAGVCIILLSGLKTTGEDQAAGLDTGLADGYIARPFGKPEFLARIDSMLRLRSVQESLREALGRIEKIASQVPGLVYQYRLRPDGSSCFPYASDAIRQIYRVSPEDVREDASKVFAAIHLDDRDGTIASIRVSAKTLTPWSHEYRVKFDDGTERWLFGNAIPQAEADGGVLWHGFTTDITERRQIADQIYHLAFYDTLTNLPNRRLLNDRLNQAIAASKRSGSHGALMFLDLDNFKSLNDTQGHEIGDLLLIEAATRLKACVRETDTAARFGGDEFVVLIGGLEADRAASRTKAEIVAEKIRAALVQPYVLKTQREGEVETTIEHHCSASIGVALFVKDDVSRDIILKWADTAMYLAKETGRNQVRFHDSNS